MFAYLLQSFLYNFFFTAQLFDIATRFRNAHDDYNDLSSITISNAVKRYTEGRVKKVKRGFMSDTQILLLDWFLHQYFIKAGNVESAGQIVSVTGLKCLKNPSPEASFEFWEILLDYVKTDLAYCFVGIAVGSDAARPFLIHDKSSVHSAGGSAARPIVIHDQSSVSDAGGSNAAGPVVRPGPVPSVGGFNDAGLLDAASQSHKSTN